MSGTPVPSAVVMHAVRIRVLGALEITGDAGGTSALAPAAHQLLAVLVAAGPDGIDRDDLAAELWGDPPPDSWMSALRNRLTMARRALGADAITNQRGWIRLSPDVAVDSWEVQAHEIDAFTDDGDEFGFLEGEPFVDIEATPIVERHIAAIAQARAALVHREMARGAAASALGLHSLRRYQRRHPFDRSITGETVRALVRAGQPHPAREIVRTLRAQVAPDDTTTSDWIDEVENLLRSGTPRRRREDRRADSQKEVEADQVAVRRAMFEAAAAAQNWGLAFDLAMSGLPEGDRCDGDPERLALLEAIPIDELDRIHQFSLAHATAVFASYENRCSDAARWVATAADLATSPGDQRVTEILRAIVGTEADERSPIPLPERFLGLPAERIDLRSIQALVSNHFERCSFEEFEPLRLKVRELVDVSDSPYRRWHLMHERTTSHFVAGEFDAAIEAAEDAHRYGTFFAIVDSDLALVGHLANIAQCTDPPAPIDELIAKYPEGATTRLGRALQAVGRAPVDGGCAVDAFLRSFDFAGRGNLVVPMLALTAPHASDPELRSRLVSRLRRRTGTSAIHAHGMVHHGPVDRILAHLVEDPDEKLMHLVAAVHVADRQQTRLWQVVCRLELVDATGKRQWLQEARSLATTAALEAMVEARSTETAGNV